MGTRSIIFFFCFLFFFLLALARTFHAKKDLAIHQVLFPITVFTAGMMVLFATRAWTSNDQPTDDSHIVTNHALLLCIPPFLVDSAFQVFGLISKRSKKACWMRYTSYMMRFVNAVMLIIDIVAAVEFTQYWKILVHLLIVLFLLEIHYIWRIYRDWSAEDVWSRGWENWRPPLSNHTGNESIDPISNCWGVTESGKPDWLALQDVRSGPEGPTLFYLLGILTLL
ncbi:hypothetical protein IE53DRAFT_392642 [Violaceomyces palustris]|uniref:Uncharacterized protein n=1 Tax=Violaceomyces palustris TaxID=1673888 RepID=A0ACD0P1P4_9BASI|nr:hypothetical protein IE53DRAFT_392642 [Violaceomyces palustris]